MIESLGELYFVLVLKFLIRCIVGDFVEYLCDEDELS